MEGLLLNCRTRMVHLGLSLGNNANKLSSRVPSKSIIRGILGASMGKEFIENQSLEFKYSFKWITPIENMVIGKNRIVYKSKYDIVNHLKSDLWINGEPNNVIDSVEYLYSKEGVLKFNILLLFESSSEINDFKESLMSPIYPLYLGKSESLLKINRIENVSLEVIYDKNKFKDFFIGESSNFIIKERLSDKMKEYRLAQNYESVYTLNNEIEGNPKYGYVVIDGENYCLW